MGAAHFPVIKTDYEELVLMEPLRVKAMQEKRFAKKRQKEQTEDAAVIKSKKHSVMEVVREKSECRNAYMNLACTVPGDNSRLQVNISYDKVANMAVDMFCDTSKAASAEGAEASSTAASSEGVVNEKRGQPKPSLLQVIARQGARPWKIPAVVERGFEIPISITGTSELGKFKRLGMDVVVYAVWLALFWAIEEGNNEAVSALKHLILDWPVDFVFIEGSTPEELDENMFKWSVNMCAKVERLRDFVGLETNTMMRIVAAAADIMRSKLVSTTNANAKVVHKWLVENVRWGTFNCPDVRAVGMHLSSWGATEMNGRALGVIEAAVQRWGRSNFLDWPTKLAAIVSKN